MGEAADRVNGKPADVGRIAGDIETLRGELGTLVSELDRRRHEAFDLSLQLRRHPVAVAVAVGAVALAAGGLLAVLVRSRRQHRRPGYRAQEARRALARLLEHPDRVAAEPSVGQKILAAAGTAAGAAVARRLVQRYVRATPSPPTR
jgi:hypothetical protein